MSTGTQLTPDPEAPPPKRRARPVDGAKKYWWAAAIAVPLLGGMISILPSLVKKESSPSSPAITINQDSHNLNFQPVTVIENEYRQKTGQPLPPDLRQQVDQADQLFKKEQYNDGIAMLRTLAEKVPVASVQTNLANALAIMGKTAEAQTLYAQAAATDPANQQVTEGRQFLAKLSGNSTILTAATIPMQTAIATTVPDNGADFFKFTAPSGPRDYLRVRLQNRSTSLALYLGVNDADKAPLGHTAGAAAADVTYQFSATPGAVHYLQVSPNYTGGGAYTLVVEPTHSFDAYEPNDTILTAKDIPTGSVIAANIMDGNDTDFYRFRAHGAKTIIAIENRSTSMAIAMAVTNADKAPVGTQTGAPAANVHYEFDSTPGGTYQLQISPNYTGGGNYAVTIQ